VLVYLCRYCCSNWSALVHIQMKSNHLDIVGESYGKHLLFTVYLSSVLLILSVVSLVHGLCPWILTGTVSDKIKNLHKVLSER